METIASFIVSAMRLPGTAQRRCVKIHAIGLPSASTIVEMTGTSPSKSCAESWAVLSDSRLTIAPAPPTNGNASAAISRPAVRMYRSQLGRLRRAFL